MGSEQQSTMARRALLTDSERELIAAPNPDEPSYKYQAVSRVRNKIQDELPADVTILREHHPELYQELRDVVCTSRSSSLEFEPVGPKNISYGPSSRREAAFVLRVGTDDGTLEVHLDEDEMYELWTEVQHTPWPEPLEEQTEAAELRQQLVDLAMGADAEMLRNALDALDPHREER